ncbi:FAD-binding protein [Actinomadura scrupuli]|uniref:FAD-binding protein n=1 Tax=Actinomadura scrupuli TaxID=559629 RepID=UPI003D9647B5
MTAIGSGAGPLTGLPPLDGRLLLDAPARSRAADDFGHLVSRRPLAVLVPGSVRDVQVLLRHCRGHGLPVAARGQGHATHGQAQVAGGVVVDMSALREVRVREGAVVAQAGARWSDVLRETLPRGLTPPVLTDYLELSVGGTLSAGGIGGATGHHGSQADNVLELEVVTGTGEHVVCSPARGSDLFRAVLAGLGQCAVIVGATMRLLPAPATVRRYRLRYPTAPALMAGQRRAARDGRFDSLQGQIQPSPDGSGGWCQVLEAVAFHRGSVPPDDAALLADLGDLGSAGGGVVRGGGGRGGETGTREIADLSYAAFLDRLAPSVAELTAAGEWSRPHPWWNVFLPDPEADAFVSAVLADLTPADLGTGGVILLYPFRRPPVRVPLLRVPAGRLAFLFALLRTASADATDPAAMIEANRGLYRRAGALGGTRYPVGSVPMSRSGWRRHFGPAWPAFAAAKRRYDPGGILAPGQRIFT